MMRETSSKPVARGGCGCGSRPCGCGSRPCTCDPCRCEPCGQVCCTLDCLVHPRFSCGQLLTDSDLTALVDWNKEKYRLLRYRTGWGVVCGLRVHRDPHHPSSIVLMPGYAVSCCGDDIVVCKPTPWDVSACCPPMTNPCDDPVRLRRQVAATQESGATMLKTLFAEATACDLVIHYAEEGSEPKTTFGRGGCGQTTECEDSRVRETFCLELVRAGTVYESASKAVTRWRDDYARCRELLESYAKEFGERESEDAEQVRNWLLYIHDQDPPEHFPFVRYMIQSAQSRADATTAFFWMLMQCRRRMATCDCLACSEKSGVPIARVWVAPDPEANMRCSILAIDDQPPYRRPIGVDCWPSEPGEVNLSRVIWQPFVDARKQLIEAGLRVAEAPVAHQYSDLETVGKLREIFEPAPFASVGSEVRLGYLSGAPAFADGRVISVTSGTPPSAASGRTQRAGQPRPSA